MGSIPLDNGESVYIHDGTGSADPVAISAAEGASIAALMGRRERFDFTWADSVERAAQTGMIQGSRGYQEDTKSDYVYDVAGWRLSIPYAEYTSSATNLADGTFEDVGLFALDAANSTDSSICTPQAVGIMRFVNAGIYSIQSTHVLRNAGDTAYAPVNARSFVDYVPSGGVGGVPLARSAFGAGEDQPSASLPIFRVPTANYNMEFYIYKSNGNPTTLLKTRLRIGRLG